MNPILFVFSVIILAFTFTVADASDGPEPVAQPTPIVVPEDKAYLGVIKIAVDASDTDRRIIRIHESVPVESGEELVLLYPKWLSGWHAPQGQINRIAGLVISSHGTPVEWNRDSVDMYAFRIAVPSNTTTLDVEFQYLSPVNERVGTTEISGSILTLEWSSVVLYPAGYFTRQIFVDASVRLPNGWQFATALEKAPARSPYTQFKRVPLETLVDSPLFAGLYTANIDLDPGAATSVYLDLFAERPELLVIKPAQLDLHRAMVQQAYKLFGTQHYEHYDFLLTLSDNIGIGGLEHHRSSKNNSYPTYFTEYVKRSSFRFLLPHAYTHSWNGKFRRPADLWAPNYNVPMRNSLLWVYKGLTEYWGHIITARSGGIYPVYVPNY